MRSASGTIAPDREISDVILDAGGNDAYKCFQCGTCMAVCPWSAMEAVAFPVYRTPQSVRLGAVLTSDDAAEVEREVAAVYRCVGCGACVARCPHEVSMPDIMRAIRRVLVEFGSIPAELKETIARVQSTGNPFGESQENRAAWADRSAWAEGMDLPAFEPTTDLLYFPCCVPSYDPRARKTARAAAAVLQAAGVSFGILGSRERCCGEAIRRVGAEDTFLETANANIDTFREAGVRRVLAASPHCVLTFKHAYPELGGAYEVLHQTQLFHELVKEGRCTPEKPLGKRVVYHDPCTLGRQQGIYDEPREVLTSIPDLELVEIPHFSRENALCCGGGGGGVWLDRPKGERLSDVRVQQAADAGAEILAVACPYCLQMFEDAVKTTGLPLQVRDVAELLAASL